MNPTSHPIAQCLVRPPDALIPTALRQFADGRHHPDGLGCFPVPHLADPGARVTAFTAGFLL
jgi:hypothetical protein